MPEITCGTCGRAAEAKAAKTKDYKLPPGWKQHGDPERLYCRGCWGKNFVLRAVTIPVGTVVEGGEWADFFAACKVAWRAATDVANWAVTELARHDTTRTHDQERLAKLEPIYLYPGARRVAPDLDPTSVVAILHAIEGKYRKARLATLWFRTQSHPVYRYPMPVPIHNQSWEWCSTPFGITEVGTNTTAHATSRLRRAQRLSASQRWAHLFWPRALTDSTGAQRLSASQRWARTR